eukprot:TRINITY_DN19614_c0_g1_i23.p1 TRINITY_DN19614_c0_g1~~TRINITY_DN19614_c0_g1_i23.p1  ORF type:complete len:154 (+),score=32.16 TRINITY_DN19614_c0_g1_i23:138-599(+)
MPVVGLPTALEVTLDALLQKNHLTSWKITGENDNLVVVIRMKTSPAADNMACPQPAVSPQYFRKKPPSQVNRDRRRAEDRRWAQRQDGKASDNIKSDDELPLFMPTPPSRHAVVHTDTAHQSSNTPHRNVHVKSVVRRPISQSWTQAHAAMNK